MEEDDALKSKTALHLYSSWKGNLTAAWVALRG